MANRANPLAPRAIFVERGGELDVPETEMGASQTPQPSYDSGFFLALEDGTRRSATATVELLIELIQPRSVIDVGCGTGIWLAAFRDWGVQDVFGVDGPWVPKEQLAIPEGLFRAADLTAAIELERGFDLALCLETAEHLPPEAALSLVESLTRLAPVVVFSAAISGQGGHGHLNEQWPSYWTQLFASQGYQCSTALRARLWRAEGIEVWYRQNMLCFAAPTHAPRYPALFGGKERTNDAPLDIVHPDLFVRVCQELTRSKAHAERLESNLRSTDDNLHKIRDELWRIRNSRPYRLYQHLRSPLTAVKRASARLWPKKPDRPWKP